MVDKLMNFQLNPIVSNTSRRQEPESDFVYSNDLKYPIGLILFHCNCHQNGLETFFVWNAASNGKYKPSMCNFIIQHRAHWLFFIVLPQLYLFIYLLNTKMVKWKYLYGKWLFIYLFEKMFSLCSPLMNAH